MPRGQPGDWSLQGSEGKYSFNPETCELDLGEGARGKRKGKVRGALCTKKEWHKSRYGISEAIGGTRENGVEKVAGMREAGSLEPKSPHGRQKINVRGFYCRPIQQEPLRPSSADAAIRAGASIQIKSSEIMREIQDEEENEGALFVLPSQLNGAEYTSHERRSIVEVVEEYKRDNTGGPRGQLAAHPAAAQFVIDNAANERQQEGINAVDQLLKVEGIKEVLELRNGYLEIKEPKDEELEKQVLALMDENLHSLRPLVMEDIPASGLTPNKGRRATDMQHKVGLVYASAVPVQAYMNKGPKAANRAFQECVARRILTAQYFGALKHAAEWASEKKLQRKVFLMPLGGGVFNNPWESICSSMANATLGFALFACFDLLGSTRWCPIY
ncbi:unnamed protein product [Cladocopium goreaui]|uniref:Uncharacterized protein n=1 Tax=Cladocopium goreaui TaxID=2562237 RepID=A0A9P1G604_9DINO|nr:unnamed protein product [Cladocopium goreaui]